MSYHLAWSYVYLAMAMDADTDEGREEKTFMLRQAIEIIQPYADEETSGVQDDSRLLIGRARRELGKYAEAKTMLDMVADKSKAKADLRQNAMFEIARAYAEQGQFADALEAAERFLTEGQDVTTDEGSRIGVRLRAPFLKHYIYELAGDRQEGELALNAFYIENDDNRLRAFYLDGLDKMYRDEIALDDIPAIGLLAREEAAFRKMQNAQTAGQEVQTAWVDEVVTLADAIIERRESGDRAAGQVESRATEIKQRAISGSLSDDPAEQMAVAVGLSEGARADVNAEDALKMAFNAVVMMKKAIDTETREKGEYNVDPEWRESYAAALELLLEGNPAWQANDPNLGKYYMELAWQYSRLGRRQDDPAIETDFYTRAVMAYEKVPAQMGSVDNTFAYFEARYMALELRLYMLLRDDAYLHSEEGKTEAVELRGMLQTYANEVQLALGTAPEAQKVAMTEWGSVAAYHAAALVDDPINEPALASEELARLSERWPGTTMLRAAQGLEIRLLVRRSRIDEAIAKLDAFREQYPEEADALTDLVISQIRAEIMKLRMSSGSAERLKDLRINYYRLAEGLFERVKTEPLADRYRATQMYAEALCGYGEANDDQAKVAEAMAIFEECIAYREGLQDDARAGYDQAWEVWIGELDRANALMDMDARQAALGKLREDFAVMLRQYNYDPAEQYSFQRIENAWAWLIEAEDEPIEVPGDQTPIKIEEAKKARRAGNLDTLATALRSGYTRLRDDLKVNRVPMDPENLFGKAQCLTALGKPQEAVAVYNEFVPKISRDANPDYYWAVKVAQLQTARVAQWDDKAKLQLLSKAIDGLRANSNGQYGGYGNEFQMLKNEVDNRLKDL